MTENHLMWIHVYIGHYKTMERLIHVSHYLQAPKCSCLIADLAYSKPFYNANIYNNKSTDRRLKAICDCDYTK